MVTPSPSMAQIPIRQPTAPGAGTPPIGRSGTP
jgi:hypothetical protein